MRYIVQKAAHIPGPQIPEAEPCLVIRGQDILAEYMMREYIRIILTFPVDPEVLDELHDHMGRLQEWRRRNPGKIKLPDR